VTRLEQLLDELSRAPDAKQITTLAEEAIGYVRREDDPILWANLNGAIASSLVNSVRGKYTPELLEKVLAAYERALTVYTAEKTPAIWAQTQRNLGATHFGAVESGLGDGRKHIEAAIQAYQHALEVSPDKHNPGIWLMAQNELANALVLAAQWRGPSAFIESGRAYAAVLTTVSREASPADWAMLNLQLAGSLSESGSPEYTEDAIGAAENALLEIRRETLPVNWGEANLLLGGLYRGRREGIRGDNLERSVHSLDNALSVFTASSDPQNWYRAHYHRGPAYLFRQQGDRAENLRRSLESLRIAIDATPKEQAPETWGSLQDCAGQALAESGEVEAAIEAFESARAVLPPDPHSISWKQANRRLGQIYLDRKSGDPSENVERAIERLTAVQESLPTPDDPRAWSAHMLTLVRAICEGRWGAATAIARRPSSAWKRPLPYRRNSGTQYRLGTRHSIDSCCFT
jgi:tetratricopeptide (TPR) repeat protein